MSFVSLITATSILLAGVIDDLRSRKVHNWLFLACATVAIAVAVATGGFAGLNIALIGFVAGIVTLLPLVLLKVIGAGDMKLFAAFGAAVGWSTTFDVAVWAFIWGAIFGVVQVALKGQLKTTCSTSSRSRNSRTARGLSFIRSHSRSPSSWDG